MNGRCQHKTVVLSVEVLERLIKDFIFDKKTVVYVLFVGGGDSDAVEAVDMTVILSNLI